MIELLLGLWAMRVSGDTVASATAVIGIWAVTTGVLCCVLAFEIHTGKTH